MKAKQKTERWRWSLSLADEPETQTANFRDALPGAIWPGLIAWLSRLWGMWPSMTGQVSETAEAESRGEMPQCSRIPATLAPVMVGILCLSGIFAEAATPTGNPPPNSVRSRVLDYGQNNALGQELAEVLQVEVHDSWKEFQSALVPLGQTLHQLRRDPESTQLKKLYIDQGSKVLMHLHKTASGALKTYPKLRQVCDNHKSHLASQKEDYEQKRSKESERIETAKQAVSDTEAKVRGIASELQGPLQAGVELPREIRQRVDDLKGTLAARQATLNQLNVARRSTDAALKRLRYDIRRIDDRMLDLNSRYQKWGGIVNEIEITSGAMQDWILTIVTKENTDSLLGVIESAAPPEVEPGTVIGWTDVLADSTPAATSTSGPTGSREFLLQFLPPSPATNQIVSNR